MNSSSEFLKEIQRIWIEITPKYMQSLYGSILKRDYNYEGYPIKRTSN